MRLFALVVVLALVAASCRDTDPTQSPPAAVAGENAFDSAGQGSPETAAAVLDSARTFVADRNSSNAGSFVEAAGADGNERWVPWLLDLMRLGLSSALSKDISDTLALISGIDSTGNRIPDQNQYGSWARTEQIDGGADYQWFKASLYGSIDDEFAPLIESVRDPQIAAAIQWGGVPRGGIPELNDQVRVAAAQADWMVDDEVVFGVTVNDESVAYPLRILANHELANDTVGGVPISVVYCTLCQSLIVYDREVAGQVLSFETSGLLIDSNKIMVDRETNTIWHHLSGDAIGGELFGRELTKRSSRVTTWSTWRAEHPETETLTLPSPIFFDDPERPPIAYDYTPGVAYASYYDSDDVWFPIIDTPTDVFEIKQPVVGIEVGDESLAVPLAAVLAGDVTEVIVAGQRFTIESTAAGAIVRDESGTDIIAEQSFWFAWYANHPETATWDG